MRFMTSAKEVLPNDSISSRSSFFSATMPCVLSSKIPDRCQGFGGCVDYIGRKTALAVVVSREGGFAVELAGEQAKLQGHAGYDAIAFGTRFTYEFEGPLV